MESEKSTNLSDPKSTKDQKAGGLFPYIVSEVRAKRWGLSWLNGALKINEGSILFISDTTRVILRGNTGFWIIFSPGKPPINSYYHTFTAHK